MYVQINLVWVTKFFFLSSLNKFNYYYLKNAYYGKKIIMKVLTTFNSLSSTVSGLLPLSTHQQKTVRRSVLY